MYRVKYTSTHWVGHCSNGCVKFESNNDKSLHIIRKTIPSAVGLTAYILQDTVSI